MTDRTRTWLVNRWRIARIAHVTGHASWWVFVVGLLTAEKEMFGLPRRYADYTADSPFGTEFGWTAYTPVTDRSEIADFFYSTNCIATAAAVALTVTVLAAVVEAVAAGRWAAGVGTVLAPVIGAAVIIGALQTSPGHFSGGVQLSPVLVFVLVLLGVAIREVWSRRFAPLPPREV
jgi:hypothetical protein